MANVNNSNNLICALSFINDQHFVQHAFKLSCSHYVCKACLEAFSSSYTDRFRCVICGKDLNRECVTRSESDEANEQLDKLYPDLLEALVKKSAEKINSIENELKAKQEKIEASIVFVNEEIELRSESIRIDIGDALDVFNEKLKNTRETFLKQNLTVKGTNENNLKKKEYLYECQNQEKEINRLTKLIENLEIDASFLNSKQLIDAKMFGNIQPISSGILDDIKMRIKEGKIKYHNTDLYKSDIRDMCVVKNKGIVTVSYDKKQVALFQDLGEGYCDYEMTGVKKPDEYRGNRDHFYISPRSVAYNHKTDKFYITDSSGGKLLMTDGYLRHISKTIKYSDHKFFGIESVSCNDSYVYVSVVGTGKVEVYSHDLNRNVDAFNLGYRPEIITVSNTTLCVSTSENVYFYDIKTKALKSFHKMNFGAVSYISPFFFVYKSKKIHCYDEDGNLIDEIDAERLFNEYDPYDGYMGFYRDSLIISQNSEQRLIELTLDI